jgi:hypothetical protein
MNPVESTYGAMAIPRPDGSTLLLSERVGRPLRPSAAALPRRLRHGYWITNLYLTLLSLRVW